MSIEILKKHMILAFKIFNIAFRLYIARGQKKKLISEMVSWTE
jgi:hypothetical protein